MMKFFIPLLLVLLLCPAAASGQDKADAALEKILARLDDAKAADGVRQELLALRRDFPGTPQAMKAAAALTKLPSPLDKLDAAKIPALERFDWQPKELVAILHEHRGRHGSIVYTIAVSPDGKRVVSGGAGPLVRIWDASTMRLQEVIGVSYGVLSSAFTHDGKTLAVGCADGTVHFWDVTTSPARNHSYLNTANRGVSSLAFSPGDKRLAIGSGDGHIHVWEGPWEKPAEQPFTSYIGQTQPVYVAFAPDGKTLAAGSLDGDLKICDPLVQPIKIRATLPAHAGGVRAVAFDPSAREQPLVVSAGTDGKVNFWRLGAAKPRLEQTLTTKNGVIQSLAFTADGKTLAFGEGDFTIHLYGMKSRTQRALPKAHANTITALAFTPKADKGLYIVSGSTDWTVRRWDDLGSRPAQKTVTMGHLGAAYAVAFAPDDRTLLTGSEDKTLRVWDVAEPAGKEKYLLQSPERVYSVAYFPDGKRVAAAGGGAEAQVWDLSARRLSQPLKGHERVVVSVAVSPDGQQILSASSDKSVRLWQPRFGTEQRRFTGFTTPVHAVAFTPDGKRGVAASGGYLVDDKGQYVLKGGNYIWTDCHVRQFELSEGGEPQKFEGHTMSVLSVAVAPDGKELASGGADVTLRLWDAAAGKETKTLTMKGQIYATAYSPDGRLLASAGSDQHALVHDRSGKVLYDWDLKELPRRLAFAADSRHLAVTLETGVVYIFRLPAP